MIPAPPVPAALRPYVAARVPYDVEFGAPGVHRGLPSATLTFVLPLAGIYLVTDEPDAVFDAAVASGATVQRPMVAHDYGGRGGSVLDPEGNHWSFGSYQPA